MSDSDPEKDSKNGVQHEEHDPTTSGREAKLDPHGYPLRPQPSDDPMGTLLIMRRCVNDY